VTSHVEPRATLAAVYDEGASSYAKYWAPALHRHACDLVTAVPSPPAGQTRTVLDVAAGVGTLLPLLRQVAGENGRLVALDNSAGMLTLADPTVPRIQADAAALPLMAGCADIAVYAFVLFLLPDARAALEEAARVLRPGAWLLAATWGRDLGLGADAVVRDELDAAGAPPFPALPRSDNLTDTPDRIRTLLQHCGFRDITTTARPLDASFDATSALAMRTGHGSLGWRYRRLDADEQAHVLSRTTARLAELPVHDFVYRSEVLLTTGRRA